jgi:glycosyltransferase involved in cell wall biosynthesis
MLVAHIGNYKPDSSNGVDKTIVGLVRHLPEHGVDVEVWHPSQRARRLDRRAEDGVTVYDLPVHKPLKGFCVFTAETESFIKSRLEHVDLLHFHSVFLSENLKIAALGVAYVVTPNGGYDDLVLSGRNRTAKAIWLRLWERPYLRKARIIQAVSLPESRALEELGLQTPVRYVANGIDDEVLQRPAPPPSSLTDFVYLGRLAVDQKGLDLLLQGYARALAKNPNLPRLVLAGPDFRGGLAQLTAMAQELSIADRVVFAGPLHGEEKWQTLSRARLFIHTSRWEGLAFALLEAMAIGRPVLVTPDTNVAESVAAARAGIVVARDVEAIGEGLGCSAALTDQEIDAMGSRARSLVQTEFSWKTIAGNLSRVYREAVRG